MAHISFLLSEDQVSVEAHIHDFSLPIPTEDDFRLLFKSSEYGQCLFLDDVLPQVIKAFPKTTPEDDEIAPLEEPLVFTIAKKLDATLEVNVTEDLMLATAHLVSAYGGENHTPESILHNLIKELAKELPEGMASQIRMSRVIKGLKNDVIERICNAALHDMPGTKYNEVIAEGRPPEDGTPTIFEYLVTPFQDRVLAPQDSGNGNVDMRNLGKIEVVDVDDKLVRRIKSKPGANGFNLIGEVLFSQAPENLNLIAGEGTKISETDPDLLVSIQDGVPIKIDNGMLVSKTLMLDNVGLSVGNIDFDGTVIVKGDVAPQMHIKATHDVVVDGIAESCTIEAKGNITILQGVIGQEEKSNTSSIDLSKLTAHLVAGKDINVRYAQAAHLEAKNNVIVSSQLLHCRTIAGESVIVGEKGQKKPKLIGGQVHAAKVAAGEIGAPANSKIVIDLSDKIRVLEKKLYELVQSNIANEESIGKIEHLYRTLSARDTTPKLEAQREKVKNTIAHIAAEQQQIEEEKLAIESKIENIKKQINIEVYGQIYPGVEFIICHEKYKTRNRVPACTIRFYDGQIRYDGAQGESNEPSE